MAPRASRIRSAAVRRRRRRRGRTARARRRAARCRGARTSAAGAGELADLLDHAGGVAGDDGAGRDVACDDGPGTHKRALADGDARENGGVGADARQAAQLNR